MVGGKEISMSAQSLTSADQQVQTSVAFLQDLLSHKNQSSSAWRVFCFCRWGVTERA